MTPMAKEKIINYVLPKFKNTLTVCLDYTYTFVAYYDNAMKYKRVRHRANLLLGSDHEDIRFQMEELHRDCMVGLRMINVAEQKSKFLTKDVERIRKFFNFHAKKVRDLFVKSARLSERFGTICSLGMFESSN